VVAAVIACLSLFGVETTTFAAVLGAAGLAIGLAFQGTLSNFAAGVMILTFRPFDIGDFIAVGGQSGTVREIGLFVVTLDTLDNRRIIISNSEAIGGVIENLTANPLRRVDIDVATHVAADVDASMAVLDAAAAAIPGRDAEHGHQIFLVGFGDGCMNWQVRVWCHTDNYWDVWHDTVLHTKRALVAANISAPYGRMKVEIDRDAA
jgi:small conductance mechanosensitive channel